MAGRMRRGKLALFIVLCAVGVFTIYTGLQRDIEPRVVVHAQQSHPNEGPETKPLSTYKHPLRGTNIKNEGTEPSPVVILLTYMRSGSSMTADILQRPTDVFYVFEPMWAIELAQQEKRDITFLNGTRLQHGTYNQTEVYMTDLRGWLTCDFKHITLQSLFSPFMIHGRKTEGTWQCLKGDTNYKVLCLQNLTNECKGSKIKLVKTLRISMRMAKIVLGEIAGSKIIHLVRDPRATLQSRKMLIPECDKHFTGESGCVKDHCDSVWNNTREIDSFGAKLKRRVVTVRYEDIITNPLENAELLYNFIGMEFTEDIKQFVYNITLGGNIGNCKVCSLHWQAGRTPGINSSSHISAWKQVLPLTQLIDIQKQCKAALQYHRYKIYNVND